jgi:hypothetical protein
MTRPHHRHREDRHEIRDPPAHGHKRCDSEDNDSHNTKQTDCKAEFEPAKHPRNFNEEVGELGFLGRCSPLHIVLEHVRKQRG